MCPAAFVCRLLWCELRRWGGWGRIVKSWRTMTRQTHTRTQARTTREVLKKSCVSLPEFFSIGYFLWCEHVNFQQRTISFIYAKSMYPRPPHGPSIPPFLAFLSKYLLFDDALHTLFASLSSSKCTFANVRFFRWKISSFPSSVLPPHFLLAASAAQPVSSKKFFPIIFSSNECFSKPPARVFKIK